MFLAGFGDDGETQQMDWQAASAALDIDLRRIGLHLQTLHVLTLEDGRDVGLVDCLIGDYAYTDAVQNPARSGTDTTIGEIEVAERRSRFQDLQLDIYNRLRRGENPFARDDNPDDADH